MEAKSSYHGTYGINQHYEVTIGVLALFLRVTGRG